MHKKKNLSDDKQVTEESQLYLTYLYILDEIVITELLKKIYNDNINKPILTKQNTKSFTTKIF